MPLKDKHVLVIGSETPWLEAILLSRGAKKVTTLGKKYILDLNCRRNVNFFAALDLNFPAQIHQGYAKFEGRPSQIANHTC